MSSVQKPSKSEASNVEKPRPMSDEEKDALIRSTIASMALEGPEISYEEVAELLDQSMEPPVKRLA